MKRVICLLLIACFMVVALVSCGGTSDVENGSDSNGAGGSGANETTEKPTDEYGQESFTSVVPVDTLDFEGETLKILHRDSLPVQREWYKDTPEDDLDEVIVMRNEAVAESLNIDVKYEPMASSDYEDCLDQFTTAIKEDVDIDLHNYDIVANYAYAGANVAVRDYIANLADKKLFPYFEFSLPCWNQAIVNTTLINDKLYYITGDLNLSTFDKTMVIFLNKTIYDEKKKGDDPADLQDVALEGYDFTANNGKGAGKAGGFTYDELYRWSSVFEDSNGTEGNQHDDFHAISSAFTSIPLDAFPYAWDLEYLIENPDGSHSYNVTGNARIEEAIGKVQNLLDSSRSSAVGVANNDDTGNCSLGGYSEPIAHFAAGKSIFALHLLYCTETDNTTIRNMEDYKFGLLPIPKYDSEQVDYGTTAHDAYTLMTVIDHAESSVPTKGEMISAYLQYATEESYTNVRGYYINRIVKTKYFGTNDDDGTVTKSIKLFNIIAANVEFTFISVYAPQLNGILNNCWRDVVMGKHESGATTAQSAYEAASTEYDTMLEEVDTWLGLK